MPVYQVKILTKRGEVEEMQTNYPSLEEMHRDFRRKGDIIIQQREKGSGDRFFVGLYRRAKETLSSRRLSDEDIYNLFYELGIMLKAGVPILKALKMISEENLGRSLKKLLDELTYHIKEGKPFSEVLRHNPLYNFTPMIPIIQMGEKTGRLWESFLKISQNAERWIRIRGEIANALIYPLLLVGTSLVAIYVVLVYVIPKFKDIVESFDVVLPFYTAVLFKVSLFFNRHQSLVVLGLVLLLVVFLILFRQPKMQQVMADLSYRLPVIRRFRFSTETLRFLNALSNLLLGGVPILLAFRLSLENFASTRIRERLQQVATSLKKGESLGLSIKRLNLFPEVIPNMISIGEESGNLAQVLGELYEYFSELYLRRIKRFMNLLEPLIIMFIALFIGMVVLSIIPIIINISDINF